MKKIIPILSALIIFLAVSCGDDDPVKDDEKDIIDFYNSDEPLKSHHDFYSMRVGTEWEYTYISDSIQYENAISKVQSVALIGSDSIFNLYGYKDSNYYNGPVNYVKRVDGLYVKTINDDTLYLWFKYPINKDDKYIYNSFNTIVKSTDTLINVPFGKLKCIHYLSEYFYPSGDIYKFNFFVSKRIGLVSTIYYFYYAKEDRFILTYESNLVNYKY